MDSSDRAMNAQTAGIEAVKCPANCPREGTSGVATEKEDPQSLAADGRGRTLVACDCRQKRDDDVEEPKESMAEK